MKRLLRTFVILAAMVIASPAQTFTVLHSFDGNDGAGPKGSLVQGLNGELYGTTSFEGGGGGSVFAISPSGSFGLLDSFCSQLGCAETPEAGLVQASNGALYGTTSVGGTFAGGTIFRIAPKGALTMLYSFCPQSGCPDGAIPTASLIQAANEDLYGTTVSGGNQTYALFGAGTIFKMTPSGSLSTLYSFCSQVGCTDGAFPNAGLVQAANGNFYGTTFEGGTNCIDKTGCGTVFQITAGGAFTTLYSFCLQAGCTDGEFPSSALVQAEDGDLYGTTQQGGANGAGTVFKITTSGTLTTLYSFCSKSGCADGQTPWPGLILATDGNLYGTTSSGGVYFGSKCGSGCGTVFKISKSGALTTLHSFCAAIGCSVGGYSPIGGIIQDTDGDFYGTTQSGGTTNLGVVFSLSVGLGPFVKMVSASGPVGREVKILGTNLAGTTSVTFHGAAAVFSVLSNSSIEATVPAGATSGTVEVVTPTGTFSGNAPFQVLP